MFFLHSCMRSRRPYRIWALLGSYSLQMSPPFRPGRAVGTRTSSFLRRPESCSNRSMLPGGGSVRNATMLHRRFGPRMGYFPQKSEVFGAVLCDSTARSATSAAMGAAAKPMFNATTTAIPLDCHSFLGAAENLLGVAGVAKIYAGTK